MISWVWNVRRLKGQCNGSSLGCGWSLWRGERWYVWRCDRWRGNHVTGMGLRFNRLWIEERIMRSIWNSWQWFNPWEIFSSRNVASWGLGVYYYAYLEYINHIATTGYLQGPLIQTETWKIAILVFLMFSLLYRCINHPGCSYIIYSAYIHIFRSKISQK
jgi:hypothetical protein